MTGHNSDKLDLLVGHPSDFEQCFTRSPCLAQDARILILELLEKSRHIFLIFTSL